MSDVRVLPLFDPEIQPGCWNERMAAGEYAVHYSSFEAGSGDGFTCTVFGSLAEAEKHARAQVAERPTLRCRIYDHRGFVGAPLREIDGAEFRGERDLSPRIRRWLGGALFFGGVGLTMLDWSNDFSMTWPATVGTRIMIPGLILLVTEAVIWIEVRRRRRRDGGHPA